MTTSAPAASAGALGRAAVLLVEVLKKEMVAVVVIVVENNSPLSCSVVISAVR